jgi:predicted RNA-binding Zn-ribbon protein involved in translation (DUF1610 family)
LENNLKDYVTLRCPSCASELHVYGDVSAFSCGQCGATSNVTRRGGTISLSSDEDGQGRSSTANRIAAELALVRLEKELADAEAWVESLESSAGRFREPDLMSRDAIVAAQRRANDLRQELKETRTLNSILVPFTIVLVLVGGVATFSQDGVWNTLVALIVSVVVGIVIWFVVVGSVVFTFTSRGDRQRREVESLERRIRQHELADGQRDRASYLPTARESVQRLTEQIVRNRRIVSG